MGVGISNPQFTATNYVLDYSINLLHPDRYGQIMQRLGPNVNAFPAQGKNQVLSDFNECLANSNPVLVSEYAKYRNMSYGAIVLIIIGFVVFIILASADSDSASFGWIIMVLFFIGGAIAMCVVNQKSRQVAEQWRAEIIGSLQNKMANWAALYPAFTFTIIWPVEVWRRSHSRRNGRRRSRKRLVAIWCYVRVTQGPCQTGFNEPIYATTTNNGATQTMVQQQPQVIVQQPIQQQPIQQQPIQQQPQQQQVVMIQQPNGQFVQGTPAMVNGQQVIMVQQQQQPIAPQPVQGYPAANGQSVVMMQQQQQIQQPQQTGVQPGYPGAPR